MSQPDVVNVVQELLSAPIAVQWNSDTRSIRWKCVEFLAEMLHVSIVGGAGGVATCYLLVPRPAFPLCSCLFPIVATGYYLLLLRAAAYYCYELLPPLVDAAGCNRTSRSCNDYNLFVLKGAVTCYLFSRATTSASAYRFQALLGLLVTKASSYLKVPSVATC
jgi:hypothetical protein